MACVLERATGLPSTHRQARFSSSFSGEVPKSAHVTTRGEHSAALAVEDDKGYESSSSMDDFVEVAHKLGDAARSVILKYFRSGFKIIDKEDLSEYSFLSKYRKGFDKLDSPD